MNNPRLREAVKSLLQKYFDEYKPYDGEVEQTIDAVISAVIKEILEGLPEERTDTRGTTQNPDNPKYLTKSATAYNQAIRDITKQLKELTK